MTLSVIAEKPGPVSGGIPPIKAEDATEAQDFGWMLQPTIDATHSFDDAPAIDVLLIPGGYGNVALEQNNNTMVEDFIRRRIDRVDYLFSVCTGAVSLAKAGVLEGKKATTNKASWAWVTSHGTNVTWVPVARWVQDGKIWSSSGVAAGEQMPLYDPFFKYAVLTRWKAWIWRTPFFRIYMARTTSVSMV